MEFLQEPLGKSMEFPREAQTNIQKNTMKIAEGCHSNPIKIPKHPWKSHKNPIETSQTYHGNLTGIQKKSYSNCKEIPQNNHRHILDIPQESNRNPITITNKSHKNANPKKLHRTTIRMAIGIPQKCHENPIKFPQESNGNTIKRL